MSMHVLQWLELRRLLRDAAEAAVGAADEGDIEIVADAPSDAAERERVIELGVTGFIVRFPDNPVLVGAISRVQGWRPNPAGSHHVPCTLKAITGMLAFAEMYDFELTDGADAMVRLLIRQSYRGRGSAPIAPAEPAPELAEIAAPQAPGGPAALVRTRLVLGELIGKQVAWLGRHWKPLLAAAVLLYMASPRVDLVREAERSFLEHQLGAAASVTTVLDALQRCESASLVPGAPTPPGCAATVVTRSAYERVSLGILNPVARVASWDSVRGFRGFVLCDQSRPLEDCWDR